MRKRLVILGAGESGTGAAVLGVAQNWDVFVSDKGKIAQKYQDELNLHNIAWEQEQHSEEKILSADLIIKSPGIPDKAPLVAAALAKGIEVIDELEFGYRYTNAKLISITGTNGKTTTTHLIEHLAASCGTPSALFGTLVNRWPGHSVTAQHTTAFADVLQGQLAQA
ncbi:MAG: Mur ligase family protein, partial [Bacteroidota bacterium]